MFEESVERTAFGVPTDKQPLRVGVPGGRQIRHKFTIQDVFLYYGTSWQASLLSIRAS